jgi:hypothetical protein
MTDDRIEAKALALANEVLAEWGVLKKAVEVPKNSNAFSRALLRAIEQHEAFKQEVSDAVEYALATPDAVDLRRFIMPKPKPDPLVDVLAQVDFVPWKELSKHADDFRAALEARGLEIREKGQ